MDVSSQERQLGKGSETQSKVSHERICSKIGNRL